ncbi:hypothetical protein BH24DEI2_BH24DEI2_00320 [soil metagenome]
MVRVRFLGLLLFCLLMTLVLAQDEAAVEVASISLTPGACSGSFVAHTLDHSTTVPGGSVVRMFEANGGGVGLGDLDNDGDLDIVLANHAGPNSILWNEGGLQFRKEALGEGEARAVTLVELDADGRLDIVFSRRVSAPNFWRNEGDGVFALELLPGVAKPLYALNWADLDADGDLDLVGASYDAALLTEFGQEFLESGKAGVYVSRNDGGKFVETRLADGAQALALAVTDLNEDGRPDVWVGNDFAVPDGVFMNTPGGWQATDSFATTTHSTMSLDTGDLDNDGAAEVFATDMHPYPQESEAPWAVLMDMMMETPAAGDPQIMANVLQKKQGDTFSNEAPQRGLAGTGWSWSAKFGDLDQDGFLDLYVVNGMMESTTFAALPNHELVEQNQVFRNDGAGYFVSETNWGLGSTLSGRGMSMGDLDGDGDLDIVVNNLRGAAQLFENKLCGGGSLQVDLLRPTSENTLALGTLATLYTDKGVYRRDVRALSGYLSGDPSRLHFGFLKDDVLERLELRWPDGKVSVVDSPPPGLLKVERR